MVLPDRIIAASATEILVARRVLAVEVS